MDLIILYAYIAYLIDYLLDCSARPNHVVSASFPCPRGVVGLV